MTRKKREDENEKEKVVIAQNGKKSEPQTSKDLLNLIMADLKDESKTQSPVKVFHESMSFNKYVFSSKAVWYWLTILLAGAAASAIFIIPADAVPFASLRLTLGLFFILFLPGFVLMQILFPDVVPIKTSSEHMDKLERVVLSLGISLILTPMVALVLNYTPWGVSLIPVTLGLLIFTVGLATVGVFRESIARYGLSKT